MNNELPERYLIKDMGSKRILTCFEAPNLQVHIKKGWSISSSAARNSAPGTIFLDGVAQCEPFLNHEKRIYNLDHHEGCVRAFTLTTCEQALVMIMKGLDLQKREWEIYSNEPELDSILAIWIILNSHRINTKNLLNQQLLFAIVRLKGIIDSVGLELKKISALPTDLTHRIMQVIDHLGNEEIQLKKENRWQKIDFIEYTVSILNKIDHILYKPCDFADFKGVEELARTELTNNRIVAVVESDLDIYELEPHLTKLYGSQLGWVALRTKENRYTLRQMNLFMPVSLEDIYPHLNFIDPAVKSRDSRNKWGGSSDMGGSPQEPGTLLSPKEIADAFWDVLSNQSTLSQIKRFSGTALQVIGIISISEILRYYWQVPKWITDSFFKNWFGLPENGFYLFMLFFTLLALLGYAKGRPWQYGLISPAGKDWLIPMPLGILCGFAGGVLLQLDVNFDSRPVFIYINAFVLVPLTTELLFRSLTHGLLAQTAIIYDGRNPWFLSRPNLAAAFLYAVFICFQTLYYSPDFNEMLSSWMLVKCFVSALGFAIVAGVMRERSQSVLTAYMLHFITLAAILLTYKTV